MNSQDGGNLSNMREEQKLNDNKQDMYTVGHRNETQLLFSVSKRCPSFNWPLRNAEKLPRR